MRLFISLIFLFTTHSVLAQEKLQIIVSILPQKFFVEQITNDEADVYVMVTAGDSPATYEPKPSQMALISRADFYFSIGVPFEQAWMERIRKLNPDMKIVQTGIETDHEPTHHHSHDHADDPHIWTNPENVKEISQKIVDALITSRPNRTDTYRKRLKEFNTKLTKLDEFIKSKTASLSKRTLIVTHPSWDFYANRYGLKQVSIEQKGKTIKAASLKNMIEYANTNDIRAIFGQPQFSNKSADILASEINAKIYILDPLAYDYINKMREMTNIIVGALTSE
ncbi:MAG: zinc ABC transporter substrate-binding protein [Pseudomonadota bacterium]